MWSVLKMNLNKFLVLVCAASTIGGMRAYGGVIDLLSGSSGCLRPDLVSVLSDVTDNDPSTMPESVTKTRNFEKLMMFFQPSCVTTETEALAYLTSIKSEYPCVSESVTSRHPNGIYYAESSGQYYVFLSISLNDDGDCCIDDGNIEFNDYCIGYIDYELAFESSNILPDLECISEPVGLSLYGLDIIDGTYLESIYTHADTLNNIENINVDLYIIDSGVFSTHNEFINTYNGVTHLDATFGDDEILSNHGTHVAGIAGGRNVGASKGLHINEYPVCGRDALGSGACFFQPVIDSFGAVLETLQSSGGRRGVINMSWGGPTPQETLELFFDVLVQPLIDITNAGGILVAAAGNTRTDACDSYPSALDVVIAVGSGNQCSVSHFSNHGECVDIYAPGSEIVSSVKYNIDTCEVSNSNYASISGTSMASPMISGVIANMLAFNDELTLDQIVNILQSSKDNFELENCLSEQNGFDCVSFAMNCDDMKEETQNLPFEFSCDKIESANLCVNNPCTCDEIQDMNCNVCNDGTGCSQCQSDYLKIDYNFGCIECKEYFGENCRFCSDFIGCQQCIDNTQPIYNEECHLFYCPDPDSQ